MLTLTALALLAADPTLPPLVQVEPGPIQMSSAPHEAKLLDDEEPTPPGAMAGRAVMAPVLGVLFGVVAGGGGGLAGLGLGNALGVRSWDIFVPIGVVGGVVGLVGLALGIALGASLFSNDVGAMFKRSVGWAFAAAGVASLVGFGLLFVPGLGTILAVIAITAAAAVPFIVESRRLAVAAEAKESSAVPVMTF
jgi:hypothetical protein